MSETPSPSIDHKLVTRTPQNNMDVLQPPLEASSKNQIPKTTLPPTATPIESIEAPPHTTETTTQKPQYTSTFTHDISDSLTRSGIQVDYVNPTPMGEGANHMVYSYLIPNEPPKVIKIAKEKSTTTLTHGGAQGESEGAELAKKTFLSYASETQIKQDPKKNDAFVVVQEAVKGNALSNTRANANAEIKKQLTEIVNMNATLYREQKKCLDFVGMAGVKGWFKKQFKKLFLKNSKFEVTNIIVDENGKLKIIDFEYFDLNKKVGFKKRVTNSIGMLVNRFLMKHYFGLDIKKGNN